MYLLTFIAEMTKALAWPMAGVGIAVLARKPVSVLIQGIRLQKLKAAGWEFEFAKQEEEVQRIVANIPAEKALPAPVTEGDGATVAAAAGAILVAWQDLERLVREAAGPSASNMPLANVADDLVKQGALQPETANGLRGLQQLRNLAVHAPSDEALSPARVGNFTTMATALRWTIENNLSKPAGARRPALRRRANERCTTCS